jgi:hypothetical protein
LCTQITTHPIGTVLDDGVMGGMIRPLALTIFLPFHFVQLLKTKILTDSKRCKLAIRIRANPINSHPLYRIRLLIVVPPQVDGVQHNSTNGSGDYPGDESNPIINNEKGGGIWDEMKRTLAYSCDQLAPGDIVDWHAIFPLQGGSDGGGNGKIIREELGALAFPILLQCHGEDHLFSRLELEGNTYDPPLRKMALDVTRQTSVLFRKLS